MKAKTLYQPWATLVARRYKTVETRDYAPPDFAIGEPLAIHAAARAMREAEWGESLYEAVEEVGRGNFPYGAIVTAGVGSSMIVSLARALLRVALIRSSMNSRKAWRTVRENRSLAAWVKSLE